MIRAAIVGATGYTGVELLRLLVGHPEVEIAMVTSRGEAGTRVDAMFPNLRGHLDLCFVEPDMDRLAECDAVFFATPNGTAMQSVPRLLEAGVRVIDLAADFRLRDAGTQPSSPGPAHPATARPWPTRSRTQAFVAQS